MFLVIMENGNGYARAFIKEKEDVTESWLIQNFLTVLKQVETMDEAIDFLIEDGWEYDSKRDEWFYCEE